MYAVIQICDNRVTGGRGMTNLSRKGAQGKGNSTTEIINGHDHVPKCFRYDSGGNGTVMVHEKCIVEKKGPTVLMIYKYITGNKHIKIRRG